MIMNIFRYVLFSRWIKILNVIMFKQKNLSKYTYFKIAFDIGQ